MNRAALADAAADHHRGRGTRAPRAEWRAVRLRPAEAERQGDRAGLGACEEPAVRRPSAARPRRACGKSRRRPVGPPRQAAVPHHGDGRAALDSWLESPEPDAGDAFLLKLFVGGLTSPEVLIGHVELFRSEAEARLEELRAIESTNLRSGNDFFHYFLLRLGIERAEQTLAWADWVLDELEKRREGRARRRPRRGRPRGRLHVEIRRAAADPGRRPTCGSSPRRWSASTRTCSTPCPARVPRRCRPAPGRFPSSSGTSCSSRCSESWR